jgi:hypothetical protein
MYGLLMRPRTTAAEMGLRNTITVTVFAAAGRLPKAYVIPPMLAASA